MSDNELTSGQRFINGIIPENPVYRQLLGMCPVLAVTAAMAPALTMAAATGFVLICANIIISLIRNILKPHLRILVFTLTIATFVTIADRFLAAFLPSMSDLLGPFVPLIIVNCLIISRCEACASKQKLIPSIADALGMSIGFAVALASIATVREILGTGKWFNIVILPESIWTGGGIMGLAPGAFITLGLLVGVVTWYSNRKPKTEAGGN